MTYKKIEPFFSTGHKSFLQNNANIQNTSRFGLQKLCAVLPSEMPKMFTPQQEQKRQ